MKMEEMFLSSDKEMVELAITIATEKNLSIEEMREMIRNNPLFFLSYDYEEDSSVIIREKRSYMGLFIKDPTKVLKFLPNEPR